MPHRIAQPAVLVAAALGLTLALAADCPSAPPTADSLPDFRRIEQAVRNHFKSLPQYRPGDIITRSDVEPIFKHRKLLGWLGADRTAILSQLPKDDEFLVRQLRTPAGRKFAARIADYPDGFDRLERLSRLPRGQRMVRDLIRGPGGYKLIEYMTTTSGGANLGRMLSKTPEGSNFNASTGRIYTVAMLLGRLSESYQKAKKAAEKRK